MSNEYILIEKSEKFSGEVALSGAKNAVLVIMASLLLTKGKSKLANVPASSDVLHMIRLLEDLGAELFFNVDDNYLEVDTTNVDRFEVKPEIMKHMRASILVMGPLLARFRRAKVSLPGGCLLGPRPIDFHLKGLKKVGVRIEEEGAFLNAATSTYSATSSRIVLEYPSVGATENLIMFAALGNRQTTIVNAAIEPEVLDLIEVLRKMGAKIFIECGSTVRINGVGELHPIEHSVAFDRLEAGALLIATSMVGGKIYLPQANAYLMDIFLEKLSEMGHSISVGPNGQGIELEASSNPVAVSFKTGPYPGFPTDLQAPMMAAQAIASGVCEIEETVFENRLMHAHELNKMGAQIVLDGRRAVVRGVESLYGTTVIASDIRASCSLVLAGLVAEGKTKVTGLHHWKRGYDRLEEKLSLLGARIKIYASSVTNTLGTIKNSNSDSVEL